MRSVTCGVRCERIRDPRFTVIDVVAWHALAWASNATNEVTSPFSVCILRVLDNEYEDIEKQDICPAVIFSTAVVFSSFFLLAIDERPDE